MDCELRFERHEQSAWRDLYLSVNGKPWPMPKVHLNEYNGVLMTAIPSVDRFTFNRVLGVGIREAATEQLVDDLIAWYKSTGACRFMVTVSPLATPTQVEQWLVERGFQYHSKSAILSSELRTIPEPFGRLQVRPVLPAEATFFGQVAASGFGWPRKSSHVVARAVGREGWQHYLVYDGAEPIATGASFSDERLVWLGFGATKSKHRRLGAQTAVIAHRIRDASENDRTPIVDTKPGSKSYRNCEKLGFEQVCLRSNYIYNFDPGLRSVQRAVSRIITVGRKFLKDESDGQFLSTPTPFKKTRTSQFKGKDAGNTNE